MGPFLFALVILDLINSLESELNLWYLDDGTLGGVEDIVYDDFKKIIDARESTGLEINDNKCELFFVGPWTEAEKEATMERFRSLAPGIRQISREELCLLGAPIFPESMGDVLSPKLEDLKTMVERLRHMTLSSSSETSSPFQSSHIFFALPHATRLRICWENLMIRFV